MREIDINGKWVGYQTIVIPEKLGFVLNHKKSYNRELGNKFGSYDYVTIKPKSTLNTKGDYIVMWDIRSSYFADTITLKDSKLTSFLLSRDNYYMLDDLFYYKSIKGTEIPKEKIDPSKKYKSIYSINLSESFTPTGISSRYSRQAFQTVAFGYSHSLSDEIQIEGTTNLQQMISSLSNSINSENTDSTL